jgi:hypothetical protein
MSIEVVFNACYGGFGLSKKAWQLLNQKRAAKGLKEETKENQYSLQRHDELLVEVVKELGREANSKYADLKIETIPIEYLNCYTISEYDGFEAVQCIKAKLIEQKLFELGNEHGPLLEKLSDAECRTILLNLLKL